MESARVGPLESAAEGEHAVVHLGGFALKSVECYENCGSVIVTVNFNTKQPVTLDYSCTDGSAGCAPVHHTA